MFEENYLLRSLKQKFVEISQAQFVFPKQDKSDFKTLRKERNVALDDVSVIYEF